MTDREALIAAIAAAPWDDLPRLVFADWLDDNGDPAQAEFIRAHIQLSRFRPATAEHFAIWSRCVDLFRENYANWLGSVCRAFGTSLPDFHLFQGWKRSWGRIRSFRKSTREWTSNAASVVDNRFQLNQEWGSLTFSRGFVGHFTVGEAQGRIHASREVFETHPITGLEVRGAPNDFVEIEGPHLARVKQLTITTWGRSQESISETYAAVFASPHLSQITSLHLPPMVVQMNLWFGTPPRAIHLLNRSCLLRSLKILRVHFSPPVIEALGEAPAGIPLEEVASDGSDALSPETWALLPATPLRETLRRLSLKSCHLTDEDMLAITRVRRWDRLTHLRLDDNAIADRGVAGMCRTCVFPELRFLNLAKNQIHDAGAVAIARSGLAQTLRFLDITRNPITATGAIPLVAALAEGPLKLVKMSARPLGRRTVRRVAEMLGNRVRFE